MVARLFLILKSNMKSFRDAFSLVILFLWLCPSVVKADSKNLYLSVGDEETVTLPYEFTSNNGTGYWSNSDPSAIEISESMYSVRIKVLQWVYHTCLVEYDYYYTEDGFSRHITYSIFIDIRKPDLYLSVSPSGGTVKKGQRVELSCNNYNAKIYYTLDGWNPSTSSSEYNSYYGIEINESCTLKAIAVWGGAESDMISERYTVEEENKTGLTVSASPSGGTVTKGTTVYLSASEYGADIYYTLDGSTPSKSSYYYLSGITISETCTLKAIAYKSGYEPSSVLTEYYSIYQENDEPTSISVSPSSKTIKVGDTFTMSYTLTPSDAQTTVTWTSDNSNIATVSSSGVVTGVEAGSTYINATTSNGYSAWCRVTVEESVVVPTSISVSPSSKTINVGDTFTMSYTLTPSDAQTTVTWTSDNSNIATVSSSGVVTGIEAGSTYINATTSNGYTAWCRVTVEKSAPTGITIDSTNFPDEYFRAYLLEQSYGNDGVITEDELKGIISMLIYTSVSSSVANIKSLKGIENFTALRSLCCADTQLTTLDVSQNTALTLVWFARNPLTSIDVSNNTALTDLTCIDSQLTSLDVSQNTALTKLDCSGNKLTSLNVSNNSALEYLSCHDNQITSLDVSRNTSLTSLYCYKNRLTSLNVSNNTALETLSCYDNQITSLDVSSSTALTSLYCYKNLLTSLNVSNNSALETLYCYDNQITSLDVSQNTILTKLHCSGNKLTLLNVSNNSVLETLSCYDNQITTLDVSSSTALTSLYCYKNLLTSLNVSNNSALETLYCYDNQITTLDISSSTALTSLYCFKNQLTSLNVSNNTGLETLSCYDNQITSLDVSENIALTKLYCENNQLTSLNVSNNIALEILECYDNQITSLDVSNNTALTKISCGSNQLTSLDVSNNTALTKISCGSNQLASLDVSKNIVLTELSCPRNQIRGMAMDNLVSSMPDNTTNEEYKFYVYSPGDNEGNVCTTTQVSAAKAKGWTPYHYDTSLKKWVEYAGSVPSGIDGIQMDIDKDAPIYNLNGQRMAVLRKGINIIGGKKVVVK